MKDKKYLKYRNGSIRMKSWDYGWNGIYFITVVTKYRAHFFGEIEKGKMLLSDLGKIAEQFWYEIPEHFPFVKLDAFVIMPNHIHGIIMIDKKPEDVLGIKKEEKQDAVSSKQYLETTNLIRVSSLYYNELNDRKEETVNSLQCNESTEQKMANLSPKSGSLSVIIRSYKSIVSKEAHKINEKFQWQSRFYDRIIRNQKEFDNVHNYIENNPLNWVQDKLYLDKELKIKNK